MKQPVGPPGLPYSRSRSHCHRPWTPQGGSRKRARGPAEGVFADFPPPGLQPSDSGAPAPRAHRVAGCPPDTGPAPRVTVDAEPFRRSWRPLRSRGSVQSMVMEDTGNPTEGRHRRQEPSPEAGGPGRGQGTPTDGRRPAGFTGPRRVWDACQGRGLRHSRRKEMASLRHMVRLPAYRQQSTLRGLGKRVRPPLACHRFPAGRGTKDPNRCDPSRGLTGQP